MVPIGKFLLLDERRRLNATFDLKSDGDGVELFEAYKEKHRADHPSPR